MRSSPRIHNQLTEHEKREIRWRNAWAESDKAGLEFNKRFFYDPDYAAGFDYSGDRIGICVSCYKWSDDPLLRNCHGCFQIIRAYIPGVKKK